MVAPPAKRTVNMYIFRALAQDLSDIHPKATRPVVPVIPGFY